MTDAEKDKPADKKEEPRIVVDDDWKAQAQAEKERLAEQAKSSDRPPAGDAAPGEPGAGRQGEIPPASFGTLVTMVTTQALLALQGIEDPATNRRVRDLDLAKHQIDTLAMLEDKTQGNLTDDEKALLDQALYQIRMQYVQVAQAGA